MNLFVAYMNLFVAYKNFWRHEFYGFIMHRSNDLHTKSLSWYINSLDPQDAVEFTKICLRGEVDGGKQAEKILAKE